MILKRLILIIILFVCFQSNASADLEVIVCDGCSYEQKEIQVMHSNNTANGTVIVIDFQNRTIAAFGRQNYYEPGYSTIFVWDVPVPVEYQYSFNEYLEIQDRINNMFSVQKSWSAIPRQLSIHGVTNAVATVQGAPYPIPNQLCTHFCVDTSSVHVIMQNEDAIRLIGIELNKAFITSNSMRYKLVMRKLLALKPLTVTVKFPDDTMIDLLYQSILFTLPWTILPDTALDANGIPIAPPSNAVHNFDAGYGNGNYSTSLTELPILQSCRTGFTNSGGGWKSQLICYLIY